MAEVITLTTPIAKPAQTTVRLVNLNIDIDGKAVTVAWSGNNGEPGQAYYPTPSPNAQPSGQTLIATLNTANLSSNSLVRRVFARLQADGYIPAGAIGGTPD